MADNKTPPTNEKSSVLRSVQLAFGTQTRTPTTTGGIESLFGNFMEQLPINVMFADRDRIIRYMNAASFKTLRKLESVLPIKADQMIGISIDMFHKDPSHQQQVLSDPSNLPVHREIQVGPETLDLMVSAIYDDSRKIRRCHGNMEAGHRHRQDADRFGRDATHDR